MFIRLPPRGSTKPCFVVGDQALSAPDAAGADAASRGTEIRRSAVTGALVAADHETRHGQKQNRDRIPVEGPVELTAGIGSAHGPA
jgi:hypothetical protein